VHESSVVVDDDAVIEMTPEASDEAVVGKIT
jgi:hypothetical protein